MKCHCYYYYYHNCVFSRIFTFLASNKCNYLSKAAERSPLVVFIANVRNKEKKVII